MTAVQGTPAQAILTIAPPSGDPVDEYGVYWREDGTSDWSPLLTTRSTRVVLDRLPTVGRFEFGVSTMRGGREAPQDKWAVIPWRPLDVSPLGTPADVTNFGAGQDGNSILLRWDLSASPNVEWYEIRRGAGTWDAAIFEARVRHPQTHARLGVWTANDQTYQIKAVTRQGVVSATAATVLHNVEANDYEVTVNTATEAGGFTGTKSGLEVSSSKLRLTQDAATANGWSANADTYTWPPLYGHRQSGTYTTAAYDFGAVTRMRVDLNLAGTDVTPTVYAAAWRNLVKPEDDGAGTTILPTTRGLMDKIRPALAEVDGAQVKVEIDTAQDATPTWDGFRVWVPGAVYKARQIRLRITLTSSGWRYTEIATMTWKTRLLNRKDEQEVTVSGTGGTAVSWTTTFSGNPKVTCTPVTTSAYFAVASSVSPSGATIYVYDAAGTEIGTATVHVHALGY